MDITNYLTYDLPVPYKNINIYPATVKDYVLFNAYVRCLTLNKNEIPDAKVISMSNLDYILYATEQNVNEQPYLYWFDRLLAMCLKDDETFIKIEDSLKRYGYNKDNKAIFMIGEEIYNSRDFDKIKTIICEQNLVDLPDENVSKEVRDSLDEAVDYKNKLAGNKPGNFEDYIISISIATGWTLEYIYSLTIRKFIKSIRRLDNLIHYKIYLASSMSGMVEFKDKSFIKHWLTNLEKENKYEEVELDLDKMKGTVSLESAKK